MRTSFHHQPEAQHPKSFSYPQERRPITPSLPPKADKQRPSREVRFVPIAEVPATAVSAAEAAHQSALIPAALMILLHFCVSRFHNAARSCGEPDLCLAPNLARLASISGDCRTRLIN